MTARELFVAYARQQVGKPYLWGANGPGAYDSSGLLCAALQAAGLKIGNHSTNDVYRLWGGKEVPSYTRPGQVFFYRDAISGPIAEAMIGIEVWAPGRGILIGARNGSTETQSLDAAWQSRAAVCTVFSWYAAGALVSVMDPWEE